MRRYQNLQQLDPWEGEGRKGRRGPSLSFHSHLYSISSAANRPPLRFVWPLSFTLSMAFSANSLPDVVMAVSGSSVFTCTQVSEYVVKMHHMMQYDITEYIMMQYDITAELPRGQR